MKKLILTSFLSIMMLMTATGLSMAQTDTSTQQSTDGGSTTTTSPPPGDDPSPSGEQPDPSAVSDIPT